MNKNRLEVKVFFSNFVNKLCGLEISAMMAICAQTKEYLAGTR